MQFIVYFHMNRFQVITHFKENLTIKGHRNKHYMSMTHRNHFKITERNEEFVSYSM